tara:strand:+ start:139 stop:315 length:177 start_codon:yes stop_codon:yes gene_type:complete
VEYIGTMQAQPGFPALAKVNHIGIIPSGTMKKIINKNKKPTFKFTNPRLFFKSTLDFI